MKQLTEAQKTVVAQVYRGLTNRQIAEMSGRSIRTVENHRYRAMKKLGVRNLYELRRALVLDLGEDALGGEV